MSKITKEQYEFALARIEELLPLVGDETPANDRNAIELTMMSDVVVDYEKEHFPIGKPSVAELIELSLEEEGMLGVAIAAGNAHFVNSWIPKDRHPLATAEGCGTQVRERGLRGAGNHVFRPGLQALVWRTQLYISVQRQWVNGSLSSKCSEENCCGWDIASQ